MNYPPSLSPTVLARCFKAANGELGVRPGDALAFLEACAADGVETLGWELWIIDHKSVPSSREPAAAPGRWCGLIPMGGQGATHVVHGEGDLAATRQMIEALDLKEIRPEWLAHVRINFTLDEPD